MLIKLKPPGIRRRLALINTLADAIFQLGIFGEVEIFFDVDEWTLEQIMTRAMQANDPKLSHGCGKSTHGSEQPTNKQNENNQS